MRQTRLARANAPAGQECITERGEYSLMPNVRFLGMAITLVVFASILMGQTTTGAITGAVTDPSGAAIPSVTISVTNTATNIASRTQSNEAGVYNFPFLPIGEYTMALESKGFK